jgi:class 3 adenylate cyclase
MRQEQQESNHLDAQEQAKQATEALRQTLPSENAQSISKARYDAESAQKIVLLAGKLQSQYQRQETMSVEQIETLAVEVGVEPRYVREALEAAEKEETRKENLQQLQNITNQTSVVTKTGLSQLWQTLIDIKPVYWWSIAWIMIPIAHNFERIIRFRGDLEELFLFLYVGFGIFLSIQAKNKREKSKNRVLIQQTEGVSRQELLEQLFAIQRELEGARVRRAFLSLDVVHSTQMKQENSELKVEYSFGQYQQWVREIVESEGGKFQSAAGDGVMCVFDSDLAAIRAGQRLLQDLSRFNNTQNQCKTPFQIRCGVHAGDVVIEEGGTIGSLQSPVLDYTAALQKQASPNSLAASGSLTEPALARIGQGSTNHEAVFLWKTP